MYRGLADLMHVIRVPGTDGVLRGAVWHPVRQGMEPAACRAAASRLRRAARATHASQSFTSQSLNILIHLPTFTSFSST